MPSRPSVLTTLITLVAVLALASTLAAQPEWSWPERAENLQVLPEDLSPERLRTVMIGFTRALGVRCSHCHVGEESAALASYDFPADDDPDKGRAREMLRMLGSIDEHLARIEPSGAERVDLGCHTCHRGRPRPMTLEEVLSEAYRDGGAAAAVGRYREVAERYRGRGAYDFGPSSLDTFGDHLLGRGDTEGAIAVFRLNAEVHPEHAAVFGSLAEAYLEAGRPEVAAVYYRKSLELDPDDDDAVAGLREIAGRSEKAPAGE